MSSSIIWPNGEDVLLTAAEVNKNLDEVIMSYMTDLTTDGGYVIKIHPWTEKHYPQTKDAILVSREFGHELDSLLFQFLLRGREADVLSEAQRLNAEREAAIKAR